MQRFIVCTVHGASITHRWSLYHTTVLLLALLSLDCHSLGNAIVQTITFVHELRTVFRSRILDTPYPPPPPIPTHPFFFSVYTYLGACISDYFGLRYAVVLE